MHTDRGPAVGPSSNASGGANLTQEPSDLIDKHIAELTDWRGDLMERLRTLINQTEPGLKEDWKWGTPVWTSKGNVCAIGAFKGGVKLNFLKGASLPDPHGLFNGGLDAKASRSIDLVEGDPINEPALQDLIRAAVAYDAAKR
jgi:hypothetical protein